MSSKQEIQKDLVHYIKKINFILENVKKLQEETDKKDLNVLDVGCGVGNISLEISKLGCKVTGIDIDKESIEYAKKRSIKNCTFLVSNAHSLIIKEKFDVIICSEVLEHLKHPERLIEFVSKNIKKSGFVFISIPNGYGPSELSVSPRRFIGKMLKKMHLYDQARNLRHSIVKNPVKKAQDRFGLDTLNAYGEGALHEQFFSMRSLKRLFNKFNLEIVKRQNSFILVGTFPFYYLYSRSRSLQEFDCNLADHVQAFISSGWSFIVKLKN